MPTDLSAAIRAAVTDWTPPDGRVLATLESQGGPNPTARGNTPKAFTVAQVFALVGGPSLVKLNAVAYLPDIRDKLAANDRPGCGLYVSLLQAAGTITAAEATAIDGVLNATEPDPSYQATLTWGQIHVGRPLTILDIAAARPGA